MSPVNGVFIYYILKYYISAPRVNVILVAQVFNGCLLPFFAICLLVCLNDQALMGAAPQSAWANCFLFTSVTITLFLAANVFLQKLFGSLLTGGVGLKLGLALAPAGIGMLAVTIFTSLGHDMVSSHRARRSGANSQQTATAAAAASSPPAI